MSFRNSTAVVDAALSDGECSDDDDEDNGPIPRQRARLQPMSATSSAAASSSGSNSNKFNVWTDMVIDQDLSDKLDSGVCYKIKRQ